MFKYKINLYLDVILKDFFILKHIFLKRSFCIFLTILLLLKKNHPNILKNSKSTFFIKKNFFYQNNGTKTSI